MPKEILVFTRIHHIGFANKEVTATYPMAVHGDGDQSSNYSDQRGGEQN